jgi:hypothetical protein
MLGIEDQCADTITTPQISEAWLEPVVERMQFRFRIRGFYSDSGSEFVNHTRSGVTPATLPPPGAVFDERILGWSTEWRWPR